MWAKMRKSLGEKRRYLTDDHIAEITQLHGSMDERDVSKLIPVERFGYRTIVVERPLRARWEISEHTWDGIGKERVLSKLSPENRDRLVATLRALPPRQFTGEDDCRAVVSEAVASANGSKPAAPLTRALVPACLTRDPAAEPMRDGKGRVVPDPELLRSGRLGFRQGGEDRLRTSSSNCRMRTSRSQRRSNELGENLALQVIVHVLRHAAPP
jgi:type I restriction enzyme M protein